MFPNSPVWENSVNSYKSIILTSREFSPINVGNETYWAIGTSFLQDYYNIYDYQNMKMGLIEVNPDAKIFNG